MNINYKIGIIVDTVDGLRDVGGILAIALVWMNPPRIAIDSSIKNPLFRKYVLWHEWLHHRFRIGYGMTKKAGRLNALLDRPGQIIFTAHLYTIGMMFYFLFIRKRLPNSFKTPLKRILKINQELPSLQDYGVGE